MRAFLFSLVLFFLAIPVGISYAQGSNAGIVQGLWYSQEKVFAGDPVRIYVAIRNNTGSDLSGTVEFFEGERRIERKNVQALDGRIIESWADWTPTYGTHTLSANLARIELHKVGSSTQAVEVTSALAEDVIFVDYDTDRDGVGNEDDQDDDSDGISDAHEKQNGTDPLVKNTPEAAVADAEQEDTEEDEQEEESKHDRSDNTNEETGAEGLERFLADSPAENVLASATGLITTAKQNLDEYRQEREEKRKQTASTTQETVNAEGFGTISRETSSDTGFDLGDFAMSVFKLIGALFSTIYTLGLGLLSFVLAYPILVQVGLLLLILLLLIKLASKFGRRPKKY